MKQGFLIITIILLAIATVLSSNNTLTNTPITALSSNNDIILSKPNETELNITNTLSDGHTLLTKFKQTDWGIWNINNWLSTDTFLAGESDWEYVFKVSEYPNTAYNFSGGNHDREILISVEMFDAFNTTPLNLKAGDSIKLKKLIIIEKTQLTFDKNKTKKYADVQRIYRITPSKILLNTTIKFTHDVYMGTSYVCMFPVTKDYGRHIKFNDTGTVITTPPTGETLTNSNFENFLGHEKTLSVDIWGDANPNYIFKVWIDNKQMVDGFNNDLKTFFWDGNKLGNKLYFSKFNDKDHKKIEPGTIWNHLQGWELVVNP